MNRRKQKAEKLTSFFEITNSPVNIKEWNELLTPIIKPCSPFALYDSPISVGYKISANKEREVFPQCFTPVSLKSLNIKRIKSEDPSIKY